MKNQVLKLARRALMLVPIYIATVTVPAFGQDTLRQSEVAKLVKEALPEWNESLLRARPEKKDWYSRLKFGSVFEAMGDQMPKLERAPEAAERFGGTSKRLGDESKIVVLDRSRGRVRYVNRNRVWTFKQDADLRAVQTDKALEVVAGAARMLGISSEDFGKARIDTQMAGGAPAGEKEIKDRYEMYRIVSIPRIKSKLPVYRSMIRSAVSNRGEIQRFMVQWPSFRMPDRLAMRTREEVVQQVTKEIMAQDPYGKVLVRAELAYAPIAPDDEETMFVPSVIVSVLSKPTPYQLVVPVADTARQRGDQ